MDYGVDTVMNITTDCHVEGQYNYYTGLLLGANMSTTLQPYDCKSTRGQKNCSYSYMNITIISLTYIFINNMSCTHVYAYWLLGT